MAAGGREVGGAELRTLPPHIPSYYTTTPNWNQWPGRSQFPFLDSPNCKTGLHLGQFTAIFLHIDHLGKLASFCDPLTDSLA
jgi:hypothetical protein